MTTVVSVVPDLTDALVATAEASTPDGWHASDGYWASDDPAHVLRIGGDDPDNAEASEAASSQQDWATVGVNADRSESGYIVCSARAWNGDGDIDAARDAVTAAVGAFAAALRADPAQGVDGLLWASFGGSTEWSYEQDDEFGAKALFSFHVNFEARI